MLKDMKRVLLALKYKLTLTLLICYSFRIFCRCKYTKSKKCKQIYNKLKNIKYLEKLSEFTKNLP